MKKILNGSPIRLHSVRNHPGSRGVSFTSRENKAALTLELWLGARSGVDICHFDIAAEFLSFWQLR